MRWTLKPYPIAKSLVVFETFDTHHNLSLISILMFTECEYPKYEQGGVTLYIEYSNQDIHRKTLRAKKSLQSIGLFQGSYYLTSKHYWTS